MSCWYEALALLPSVLETPLCLIYSPQMYAISLMDSTGIRDLLEGEIPKESTTRQESWGPWLVPQYVPQVKILLVLCT